MCWLWGFLLVWGGGEGRCCVVLGFFFYKVAVRIRVTECLTAVLQRFPGLSVVRTEFQ